MTPEEEAKHAHDEMLKKAFKAFKKRLKLTKLDDESRLGGHSPLTKGDSGIRSIIPPREYPKEVWDELVARELLAPDGGGFLKLGPKAY